MATVSAAAAPSDLTGISVVLIGSFTSAIVQPSHLIGAGLITEADLAQLRYEILAPEISVMQVPWMSLVLEPGKLTAQSTLLKSFVTRGCAGECAGFREIPAHPRQQRAKLLFYLGISRRRVSSLLSRFVVKTGHPGQHALPKLETFLPSLGTYFRQTEMDRREILSYRKGTAD